MNLLDTRVIHKTLGSGIVKAQNEKHITIEFDSKTCIFQYPEAFRNFLIAEDAKNNEMLLSDIAANDAEIAKEKQKVKEARRAEAENRLDEFSVKTKNKSSGKIVKRVNRVEGQYMTFLVFQGNTFDAECRGGFIWAPKYNQGGGRCHHWDRLMDVRKGDFIIHCAEGYIQSFSVAKGTCYDAESPRELTEEQLWAKDGRMVDCEYIKVSKPIRHSDYKETILKYCTVKYAPFDKSGNGNMGYLFDLNKELAKFFVEMSVVKNRHLLDIGCIQEILK